MRQGKEYRRISIISNIKHSHTPAYTYRSAWAAKSESKKSKREFLLSTWRLIQLHFAYCCRTTSLHCFQYLSDPKCSTKERLLWACVLTAAVCATVHMFSYQFHLYYNNPIFYSHLAVRKLIKDIPFPAVTVCSHNQIPASAFNYSAALHKPRDQLTDKESVSRYQLDFANYFCEFGEQRENFHDHLNVSVIEEIFQIKYGFCAEEFVHMEWQRQKFAKPCDFLQQVLSWYGHCYTFNMVPFNQFYQPEYSYWYSSVFQTNKPVSVAAGGAKPFNTEDIVLPSNVIYWDDKLPDTPWNTNDSSLRGGVIVTLNFRSHDFDNTCSLGDKSFSVIVHPPDEIADWSHPVHVVGDNSVILVKLFPEVVLPSKGLEALPPSRRGCYIKGEKTLHFYQVYNQRNCETECHANWSMAYCGCVAYFHPRDKGTPVCNQAKSTCLIEVQQNIGQECDCLPTCGGIHYNTEVITINKHKRIHPLMDLSMIIVQFPSKGVSTKVMDSIGGKLEILSNLGGVLSLFLGAGVVSLIEIVYMCTLRPLVTVWNYRRRAMKRKQLTTNDMWSHTASKVAWWH